jgi:hypothetical protein
MRFVAIPIVVLLVCASAQGRFKDDHVPGYSFWQFTDNDRSDSYVRVSSQGLMVWVARYHLPGAESESEIDAEILYWDGNSIKQITDNDVSDERAVINNLGEIAWQRFGAEEESEIFARSNGTTTQITNDPVGVKDRYPDINDRGVVVWTRRVDHWWRVAVYDPTNDGEFDLAVGLGYRPHINSHDHFVGDSTGVRNLDGSVAQSIPSPKSLGYTNYRRWEINQSDQLALEADPNPDSPWLTDGVGPRDILFWDGSEMRTVYRSPGPWVGRVDLNDEGVVAFEGFGGLPTSVSPSHDSEIFVYDPRIGIVVQLTDDDKNDWWPTVTEDGQIFWHGVGNYPGAISGSEDLEIFSAIPDDDFDDDGVSNVNDNCPIVPNTDQTDSDNDNTGDACDNCRKTPNPRVSWPASPHEATGKQVDDDADGIGNPCDFDFGDPSDDDIVNVSDLLRFLAALGHRIDESLCPDESGAPVGSCARYDLDVDNDVINLDDLLMAMDHGLLGKPPSYHRCAPADDGSVHCPLP